MNVDRGLLGGADLSLLDTLPITALFVGPRLFPVHRCHLKVGAVLTLMINSVVGTVHVRVWVDDVIILLIDLLD